MTTFQQAQTEVARLANRAADCVASYTSFGVAPENVSATVEAEARCKLIFGVLESFTRFCYESSGSVLINLAGNFQIPSGTFVPFAFSGKRRDAIGQRPQLTEMERAIVRLWLLHKHEKNKRPLFYYAPDSRRWCVDTTAYPTVDAALTWLAVNAMQPKQFLFFRGQVK